MKKRLLKLTCLLMLLSVSVYAQRVTGKVTAATDGAPMPGVSVLLKGTTTGTATDSEGVYTLNVSDASNSTLVFSFIGYVTKEVPLQGRSAVDVALAEDATQLSEVVVTALGISRQTKTLVYATQQVKPSQLIEVKDANNVLNSLQGKIANAVITQGSGGPGSGARIVLRGNRSIQGSNNALIVVDGVPITNGTNGTITSDFGGLQGSDGASNINPDDIESMTILRGASAAALYGSAAGNGVIVITTKKGGKDRVSVTINSGVTTERPFVLPKFQNEYGQGNSGIYNKNSGESWGAKLDGSSKDAYMGQTRPYSAQEDNVKDFFRTGVSLNNSIGISGGSEKMQTYLSYTNNSIQGILPRNDLSRHAVNLRVSNQIGKKLKTDAKINYILQNTENKYETGESALSPTLTVYQIPRNVSLSDAKDYQDINNVGVPVRAPYPVINPALYQNPYWIVNNTETDEVRNRIMGFLSAEYAITDWLKLSGRGNMDKYTDVIERQFYAGTVGVSGAGGSYARTEINVQQYWFDTMLEGKNTLTDDLKIDYRVGAIIQDNKFYQLNNTANGLNVTNKFGLNFATNPVYNEGSSQVQTQSVFGQINLAYKEAIFLDASLRNDWSSTLPDPYSFSYPSVGVSAILSDLFTIPDAISFLKLNASYAEVGNGGRAQLRFNTYNYSPGGTNGFIFRNATEAIPNLKPEIVKNIELGLEMKFIENRLGVQFTYYKSNSFNQLLQVSVPVATGFSNKYINAGNIQNQGVEVVVTGTPLRDGPLRWDIDFNMGMNRNKIVELTETTKQFTLAGGFGRSATPLIKEGGSYGDMEGFYWKKDANGNFLVTPDGKPLSSLTTGEYGYLGNFNPKATVGLTNTFNYNNFSLRILIDGRVGGTVVDGTEMFLAFNGAPEVTSNHREGGWVLGGKGTDGSSISTAINAQDFWTTASGGRYGSAEFFTYDATSFRVRELSFGYTIPVPENSVFKSVKISAVARNLFFLYRGYSKLEIPGLEKRKMNFDPDMSLGNGNWQGVSYGTLPSTRSLGFNLQLTF
ncbi:MAG: SusC/RagA family TonB-linked outer membrane protein [Cyclobacteriaceae bacterium]|nr:SusC/RagA family TonB-linked outer membrane protein [Cyclobacteriaceae bacterium]